MKYVGFCQGDCDYEGQARASLPKAFHDAHDHMSETDRTHVPGVKLWEHPQLFNDRRQS